jgi:hypothetical protein
MLSLNFYVSACFNFQCHIQIFKSSHIFKQFLSYLYVVIVSSSLFTRHKHLLTSLSILFPIKNDKIPCII